MPRPGSNGNAGSNNSYANPRSAASVVKVVGEHPKTWELEQLLTRVRRLHVIAGHLAESAAAPPPSGLPSKGLQHQQHSAQGGDALQLVPLPGTALYTAWLDEVMARNGRMFAEWTRGFYSSRVRECAIRRLAVLVRHLSSRPMYEELD